jgi:glycerol-3-phosphate dehydrogenase
VSSLNTSAASGQAPPVLILGAGINGAALAREFLLNGMPVVVVDTGDLARGATAYSSRLIHGGLRYLEYGEIGLVRESLAERARLLRLAPQFVQPLKLFIPLRNRFGGLLASATRFLKLRPSGGAAAHRGLWLVRAGLQLYDWYARDPTLPKHQVLSAHASDAPPIDRTSYPWLCAYYDAQIRFPERFVVALFDDARRLAAEKGLGFQILTYHRVDLDGTTAAIHREAADGTSTINQFKPAAILNATGAWVDQTLNQLHVSAGRLMGGTKGSHFVTSHAPLRQALYSGGIYAEAPDGRPIFILPFGQAVLVGTTDLPYSGDPADAVATEDELQYLLGAVNQIFPAVGLTRDDIDLHYSGVRPLPLVDQATTAAITRRHWLQEHAGSAVPLFSVIGGKLTTCRSLAEASVTIVRQRLGLGPSSANSQDRPLPGGENYPADPSALDARWRQIATRTGFSIEQVGAVWNLCGTHTADILSEIATAGSENLAGTHLPRAFVRRVIDREWVHRLDDLVERRLMLLYHRDLTQTTLRQLALIMAEAGILGCPVEGEVRQTVERLRQHFGKRVAP